MDGVERLFSNAMGVLLRIEEERQLVCSAALACGLEPVDLAGRSARAGLQLIVTDGEWPSPNRQVGGGSNFPLIILVQDKEQDAAWVLHRPLRLEAVKTQLRQATYANRVSAERNRSVFEQLQSSRRIFDSVSNGITIADARAPDLPLVYVNPAFERMTGYSAHEAYGRNCRFLQGSDKDQPALEELRKAIREQSAVRVVLRNYRKDGTLFWNEFYLSPITDLEGRLTSFVGIQNDVTAEVDCKQKVGQLMERLEGPFHSSTSAAIEQFGRAT